MEDPEIESTPVGVDFGQSFLAFSRKFWWAAGLSAVVILAGVLASANGWFNGLLLAAPTILGAVIGILLQPTPKPVDHGPTATASVERLMDMGHAIEDSQTAITELAKESQDGLTKLRLLSAQDGLLRQTEHVQRSVTDWDEVSPGVVEKVRAKRDKGRQIFFDLVRREADG